MFADARRFSDSWSLKHLLFFAATGCPLLAMIGLIMNSGPGVCALFASSVSPSPGSTLLSDGGGGNFRALALAKKVRIWRKDRLVACASSFISFFWR